MKNISFKKLASSFLVAIFLATSINLPFASAQGFSDVFLNTPNNEAILYLQENNIIQGYDDGTFKPNRPVNRAEFLKIIIEGSNIDLDVSENTPFPDIIPDAWYVPYVNKAYAEGWINGYNDGTFKPGQTINKVESLKILAKAQKWPLENIDTSSMIESFKDIPADAWYLPYITYAKTNNYLVETDDIFSPEAYMTRASISGVIYRTILNPANNLTTESTKVKMDPTPIPDDPIASTPEDPSKNTATTTPLPTTPQDSTPTTNFKLIPTNAFEAITLDESIPNIFYKNEVYILSGTLTSGSEDTATVILDAKDKSTHQAFAGPTTNNHFDIPVHFDHTGDFYIGIIPGKSGNTKAYQVSVSSDLPTNNIKASPLASAKPKISYAKDTTSVSFTNTPNTLKKLTFNQNNQSFTYFFRQDKNYLPINYADFKNFKEGDINYHLDIANLNSQKPLEVGSDFFVDLNSTFTATEHSFAEIDTAAITATPPDNLDLSQTISFSGTVKTDIRLEALVIKPDGFVDKMNLTTNSATETYFSSTVIKNGGGFTFNYSPKTKGRYIVEINNKNNEPIINYPVYVGNIIPLIPDYFDLYTRSEFEGTLNLDTERQKLLDLINKSRNQYGLNSITLAVDLNTLAQNHSEDMKKNNYFGHYNLQNQTPEDRRIALGIPTGVGENLAKDSSVEFGHHGLMRSASHRSNILTKEWTRVGIGLVVDDGQLIIAEEFSTSPLTANDLIQFRADLFKSINDLRQTNSKTILTDSTSLTNASKQVNTDSVNGVAITNSSFESALVNNGYSGSAELAGRVGSTWSTVISSFVDDEKDNFLKTVWQSMGIDIQTDKNGKIYTIVITGSGS